MRLNVADRVSSLADESSRIERESEAIYLELGRLFPRLSAEMKRSVEKGEASLQALARLGSRHSAGGSAGGPVVERAFVEESAAFLRSLRDRDTDFLSRVNEGISKLDSLESIIARVRADSEEMEIISLNAMTVALKSGAEGKAFSVITDELKRISGRTIALAEGVTASGRSLLEFFGSLRNALGELDEYQGRFFDELDAMLGAGFAEVEGDLSEAVSFYSSLMAEAKGVSAPVLRIMSEVQLQDIVRQSLQHVGLSLEEARSSASIEAPAQAAFVAAVAELSGNLIEDVVGKLDASAQAFGEGVDAVSDIIDRCERKRGDFLAKGAGRGGKAEANAFQVGSDRYLELKRSVVSMAAKLSEQVKGLDASFKGLAAILSRFQNIVVASRIEVAKTRALAGVVTTVGEMVALTDRIAEDVGEAMDATKDFTKSASEAIKGYAATGSEEGERLVSTLGELDRNMRGLSQTRESIRAAIDDFALYTADFIDLIRGSGEGLERLRDLSRRLKEVGSSLEELSSAVREELGPDGVEVESDRMRRMVERFTIFTHKKAAGDIGRFEVEEGGSAGEVTLF